MKTHIFLVFMRYAEFLYPILQKHMGQCIVCLLDLFRSSLCFGENDRCIFCTILYNIIYLLCKIYQ